MWDMWPPSTPLQNDRIPPLPQKQFLVSDVQSGTKIVLNNQRQPLRQSLNINNRMEKKEHNKENFFNNAKTPLKMKKEY